MEETIYKNNRYEYAQALQLIRLSLENIPNPYIASLWAVIFGEEPENDMPRKVLQNWLYNYISSFILNEPRGQSDLREKTLALVAYLYLDSKETSNQRLPDEFISKYLNYAGKQDWYEDNYLAFYCLLMKDQYVVFEGLKEYFKKRYQKFLEQGNIDAISQSIFVLEDIRLEDKTAGWEKFLEDFRTTQVQLYDLAWGFVLSSHLGYSIDLKTRLCLELELFTSVSQITDRFFSQLLSLTRPTADNPLIKPIPSVKHIFSTPDPGQDDPNLLGEDGQDNLVISSSDLADLSLITFCLRLSKAHWVLGVVGYSEQKLNEMVAAENNKRNSVIQISKKAAVIGNLLAILSTLLIGCVGIYYLWIINLKTLITNSPQWPALGEILFLIPWLDYLLSQIQAVRRGESALEAMTKIPLMRYFGRTKKTQERN